MRRAGSWALLAAVVVLAGCGGGGNKGETETASGPAKAACSGSAISATKLPSGFPSVANVTYTKEHTEGPTEVVEGYFTGSVRDAHEAFKTDLNTGSYQVTHDELDEHDSEVNWKGKGRSGQVALREECGERDKIYVQITNRPA